jgi:hypothetical protein
MRKGIRKPRRNSWIKKQWIRERGIRKQRRKSWIRNQWTRERGLRKFRLENEDYKVEGAREIKENREQEKKE